jgi:hypothetical protein
MRVDAPWRLPCLWFPILGLQRAVRVDDSLAPVLLVISYTRAPKCRACGRLLGACPACGFGLDAQKTCSAAVEEGHL